MILCINLVIIVSLLKSIYPYVSLETHTQLVDTLPYITDNRIVRLSLCAIQVVVFGARLGLLTLKKDVL